MWVMIKNIYLKFEVDTFKNKEVIIFLNENLSLRENKSENIASTVMTLVT
jgi:hypothetical protein